MRKASVLLLASLLALAACQSVPKSVSTSLAPNEYFQVAQQYADRGNYRAARFYYDTFIQRYPNDPSRIVEAQYEIAFLYFRTGDYAKARQSFTTIVDRYKQSDSDSLPRWPLVLANKLLIEIDQRTNPRPKAASAQAPTSAQASAPASQPASPPAGPAEPQPAAPNNPAQSGS